MTTINSLNSLSAKTGIGGLVSGMDIDELVKDLTISGREKIVKEQQAVQKLEWKQSAYRSVIKALGEFQSSYLDLLSATNFRNKSLFNTFKAEVSSNAVSVTPTSAAMSRTITIGSITQLAEAMKISGGMQISKALSGTIASESPGALSTDDISDLLSSIEGKSISLNLDGKLKTITFDDNFIQSVNSDLSAEGLESAMQELVDKAFGVVNGENRVISVSINGNELSFDAPGSTLAVNAVGGDVATLAKLGLKNSQTNRVSLYTSLDSTSLATELAKDVEAYEFSINGIDFEIGKNKGLYDVIQEINSSDAGVEISYSSVSDSFSITAKETGAGDNIIIEETQGNLLTALGLTAEGGASVKHGENAMLKIDGQEIIRSSNTFNIDGISIELNEKTEPGADPITINIKEDTSALREPLEKFLEDYNALIDLIHGLISEKPNAKYPPLTEEQKSEMTEKQIEQWETKAKAGILANDSVLRNLLFDLRSAMSSSAKEGGIRLYDLGITSGGYQDNGKLKISDENKFLDALKTKGSQIAELFTTSKTGIANRVNDIIEGSIKRSGAVESRGRLVRLAGIELSTSEKENNISKMIEQTNKRIATLQLRLTANERLLWSKFSAMEAAIQRLDAQSAMLMQFTPGGM